MRWYAGALVSYGNGAQPLSAELTQALAPYCGDFPSSPPPLDDRIHRDARLAHLAKAGSKVVWSMVEYQEIARWMVNQRFGPDEAKVYCSRLQDLKKALDCVRQGSADCNADAYTQELKPGQKTTLVFVPSLQSLKQSLAPVVDELVVSLVSPERITELTSPEVASAVITTLSIYRQALDCAGANTGPSTTFCSSREQFANAIVRVATAAMERKARLYIYGRLAELPQALQDQLLAELPPERRAAAEAAWQRLKGTTPPSASPGQAEQLVQAALAESLNRVADELAIATTVDVLRESAAELVSTVEQTIQALSKEALAPIAEQARQLWDQGRLDCAALDDINLGKPGASDSWGRKPDGDTPGYRFVAKPSTSRPPVGFSAASPVYSVRLEVLLPTSVTSVLRGVGKVVGDPDSEPLCPERQMPTLRVIDAGIEILNVQRLVADQWAIFQSAGRERNLLIRESTRVLFEELGLPLSWLDDEIRWQVSPDFRDVWVFLPSIDQRVEVIREGTWVFSAEDLFPAVCQAIVEKRINPALQ